MIGAGLSRALLRPCVSFAVVLMAIALPGRSAQAQNLQPYDLMVRAAGTNLLEAEFSYNDMNGFRLSNGDTVPDSGFNSYFGTLRYDHYFTVAGHPAAIRIFQSAGIYEDFRFGGVNLPNTSGIDEFGATNTTLSAEFWPYVSPDSMTQVFTAAYLTPPDGSYNQNNTFNTAYGGWAGAAQVGVFEAVTSNLALEGAFDAAFSGDEPRPGGSLSMSPVYDVQIWADWDWGNGFQTSLGYLGAWGGIAEINGAHLYRDADVQRLRADVAYWWTPRLETDIQLAHDVAYGGGYGLDLGATARVRFMF